MTLLNVRTKTVISFCATSGKCEEVRCTDTDIENGICVFPSDEQNILEENNTEL